MGRTPLSILVSVLVAIGLTVVNPGAAQAAGGQVRGGDTFFGAGGTRCVVGFTVVGGFVTSGRCGRTGDIAFASPGVRMGVFAGSSFPGNDYAWVRLDSGWTPLPQVRRSPLLFVNVTGASSAPVGATVCKYGPTTGWRCGVVQAKNATVTFPGGTVSGLTRTSVCSEAGENGAPFMSGTLAQGMLVGGSGNCSTGGTSFFQPVAEPLTAFGLTLLTT